MTSFRKLLLKEMEAHGETFINVIAKTISDKQLDIEFDDDLGCIEGIPFTIWTDKRVYFPVAYDGDQDVASVARFPDGVHIKHVSKGG